MKNEQLTKEMLQELGIDLTDEHLSLLNAGGKVALDDISLQTLAHLLEKASEIAGHSLSVADFSAMSNSALGDGNKCSGIRLHCWKNDSPTKKGECCLYLSFPNIICVSCGF